MIKPLWNKPEPDPRSFGAFTLVELLVVIAIISVLSSLLLSSLARAKEKAKQTVCLSGARQLSLGVMLYTEEFDQTLPPSTDYGAPTALPERIWPMKILPYVPNKAVFVCPSTRQSAFPSNWTDRGMGSVGYTTATAYDPNSVEGFPTPTRVAMMDSPTMTPVFGDTASGPTDQRYRGYVFDPYNGQPNAVDPRMGTPLISDRDLVSELSNLSAAALKPMHARHSGRIMLIFGDGHAQFYSVSSILAQDKGARLIWRFRSWPPALSTQP